MTSDAMDVRQAAWLRGLARHLEAENAHDVDAIMATFAPDTVFSLNGERVTDHAVIRLVHERFGFGGGGAFSQLRVREVQRYLAADAIVVEETVGGTHTGPFEGVAATGRAFEVAVCTVYRFDDQERLTAELVYFDRLRVLAQLGAARSA